jgi:hypothetical protein
VCDDVYSTAEYSSSVRTMSQVSLERDMVFRDGWSRELGTATGSPDAGDLAVTLTAPV